MIRLGLCCIFTEQPIKFRQTTAAYLDRLKAKGEDPYLFLFGLIEQNARALESAIDYCLAHDIGSFRINSRFCPLITHPVWGYKVSDLPVDIKKLLHTCHEKAQRGDLRLTFHPDQFVVLNSLRDDVVEKSLLELEAHAALADLVGADVINIHGGGVFGSKEEALKRMGAALERCSSSLRSKLTLENDEFSYTALDLLPFCRSENLPFVFDVHHHRCSLDALTIEEVTHEALKTWNREPLFHISSPLEGYTGPKPQRHHDYIRLRDFPPCWFEIEALTVEVEAKAKELAVARLQNDLVEKGVSLWQSHGTSL